MRKLDHKAIVKFEEQIETKDRFFIVLELAPGGELFDMIVKRQKFDESQAKMYFYQMISAIQVYILNILFWIMNYDLFLKNATHYNIFFYVLVFTRKSHYSPRSQTRKYVDVCVRT